jgi:hypothetical protein
MQEDIRKLLSGLQALAESDGVGPMRDIRVLTFLDQPRHGVRIVAHTLALLFAEHPGTIFVEHAPGHRRSQERDPSEIIKLIKWLPDAKASSEKVQNFERLNPRRQLQHVHIRLPNRDEQQAPLYRRSGTRGQ